VQVNEHAHERFDIPLQPQNGRWTTNGPEKDSGIMPDLIEADKDKSYGNFCACPSSSSTYSAFHSRSPTRAITLNEATEVKMARVSGWSQLGKPWQNIAVFSKDCPTNGLG
jgi:hypothetical protein